MGIFQTPDILDTNTGNSHENLILIQIQIQIQIQIVIILYQYLLHTYVYYENLILNAVTTHQYLLHTYLWQSIHLNCIRLYKYSGQSNYVIKYININITQYQYILVLLQSPGPAFRTCAMCAYPHWSIERRTNSRTAETRCRLIRVKREGHKRDSEIQKLGLKLLGLKLESLNGLVPFFVLLSHFWERIGGGLRRVY